MFPSAILIIAIVTSWGSSSDAFTALKPRALFCKDHHRTALQLSYWNDDDDYYDRWGDDYDIDDYDDDDDDDDDRRGRRRNFSSISRSLQLQPPSRNTIWDRNVRDERRGGGLVYRPEDNEYYDGYSGPWRGGDEYYGDDYYGGRPLVMRNSRPWNDFNIYENDYDRWGPWSGNRNGVRRIGPSFGPMPGSSYRNGYYNDAEYLDGNGRRRRSNWFWDTLTKTTATYVCLMCLFCFLLSMPMRDFIF